MEDGGRAIISSREQLPSWEEAEVKYLLQLRMAYCNLGGHLEREREHMRECVKIQRKYINDVRGWIAFCHCGDC